MTRQYTRGIRHRVGRLRPMLALLVVGMLCAMAMAEDWPTYRHDIARSNMTGEQLALPLNLRWTFEPPHPPEPAWSDPAKEKARVRFDDAYHVAVARDAVYFGSSADNQVYCLDAATGDVRWTAFTGGPIRVAPTVVGDKVYVGSDDGYAYCLRANDGALVWRVRAPFDENNVLGNGRMISLWPIRTGVLVDKGVAYFGAGVFPHETTFLCAVDAETGRLLWRNDTFSENSYTLEFGGISPQGALLASDSTLFVPSGRAMPAAFSRETGDLKYYCSPGGKIGGTWVLLTGDRLIAGIEGKRAYDTELGRAAWDNAYAWFPGLHLVVTDRFAYMVKFDELCALDRSAFSHASEWRARVAQELKAAQQKLEEVKTRKKTADQEELALLQVQGDRLTKEIEYLMAEQKRIEDGVHRWRRPCAYQNGLVLAGETLFLGGEGSVAAADSVTGEDLWNAPAEGTACGLAVAGCS